MYYEGDGDTGDYKGDWDRVIMRATGILPSGGLRWQRLKWPFPFLAREPGKRC